MLLLRLLLILVALLLVLFAALYLFAGQRRYVQFAWQTMRFSAVILLLFGVLFVLERYVLSGWRLLF
jgi:hypothetical protein